MKYSLRALLLLTLLLSTHYLFGQQTDIWEENFNSYNDGDVPPGISTKSGTMVVYSGELHVIGKVIVKKKYRRHVQNSTWISEDIDISCHSDVSISLNAYMNRLFDRNSSKIKFYYSVDGRKYVMYRKLKPPWGSELIVSPVLPEGSVLSIKIVCMLSTKWKEAWPSSSQWARLDNIKVVGTPPSLSPKLITSQSEACVGETVRYELEGTYESYSWRATNANIINGGDGFNYIEVDWISDGIIEATVEGPCGATGSIIKNIDVKQSPRPNIISHP